MSSITSALSSLPATTASSTAPAAAAPNTPAFNGTSQYAQDLQNALTRAVQIASIPVTRLNDQKSLLTEQQQAYQSLQGKIADVSTAIQGITAALGSSSYSAANSNPPVATAFINAGALEGSYTLNVLGPGSFTQALSDSGLTTVTDPASQNIAAGTTFTLSVNGTDTNINLSSRSLNTLAAAINQASAGVQATVINIGPSSAPDYRLSLQSTTTQDIPIDLTAAGTSILSVQTHGSEATYQVNGQPPAGISSTTRTVTVAPGIAASIQDAGSTVLTVSRDTTALSTALTTLVTTYNDAIAELSQYHGQNGGVLEGQSEVRQIESNLRSLVNYTGGTGTATSLTALGLSFDSTGKLTFRSSALNSASISDVSSFFGDGVQPGFILNAENILNSINDPVSGTLGATVTSISTQISNVSTEIDAAQQRISVLQTDLTARLSAADATIAELEQQASYFTSLFAVERQNSQNITAQ